MKTASIANFTHRYVAPHSLASRKVEEADLPRVLEEMTVLYALCYTKHGRWAVSYAMAHPQIDDKDPLALFVTREAHVVINPRIIRHTAHGHARKEACMSFPEEQAILVERYNKITVEYQTITEDNQLSETVTSELKGVDAQIWQHEIDHLEGKYIYGKV